MTEETPQSQPKFTDNVKPARKEDLPLDMQDELFDGDIQQPHSAEDMALINGQIAGPAEEFPLQEALMNTDNIALRNYQYWSQFESYDLEMSDGKTVRYQHQFPNTQQVTELQFMWAQVLAGMDENEKPMNPIRQHHFKELWYDRMAEYYLLNTKTRKPMTHQERMNCANYSKIMIILKTCMWRSNNDVGPIRKN